MKMELRDVSLQYEAGELLFEHASMTIEPGEFVLIEGPSGSGKSSLLRLLNRLQEPTSGSLWADEQLVAVQDVPRFRRRVAYLQQTPVMLEGDVEYNLLFPFGFRSAADVTPPTKDMLATELQHYQLDVKLADDATRLSQGQKQRLALIRALLLDPSVLLCDEPTSSLDTVSRQIVQDALERQSADHNRAVIVVTHIDFQPRCAARRFRLTKEHGLQEVPS